MTSRRGRPRKQGLRTRSGELSHRAGARPDERKEVAAQPHRKPFVLLFGDNLAGLDADAGFALGRLRLFGRAEEQRAAKAAMPVHYCMGINEREFRAGQAFAQIVARERFARGAPKDRAAAISFMQARGIDLSAREMTPAERQRAVADFDDARAILAAAPLPPDARKSHSRLVRLARGVRAGSDAAATFARLARGLPALVHPVASDAVMRAVMHVAVEDSDVLAPARATAVILRGARWANDAEIDDANTRAIAVMTSVRRGLDALAFHFEGDRRGVGRRPDGTGDAVVGEKARVQAEYPAEPEGQMAAAPMPTRQKAGRDHPFR